MAPIDATGWVMAGLLALLDLVLVAVVFHKEIDQRIARDDALARAEREIDRYKAAVEYARADSEELRKRVARLQVCGMPRAVLAEWLRSTLKPDDIAWKNMDVTLTTTQLAEAVASGAENGVQYVDELFRVAADFLHRQARREAERAAVTIREPALGSVATRRS